jgi:hypothetical protein
MIDTAINLVPWLWIVLVVGIICILVKFMEDDENWVTC